MLSDLVPTVVIPAPTTFDPAAWTVQAVRGDARNFKKVAFYIAISNKDGETSLQAEVKWYPSDVADGGFQQAEGSPASGVVTANTWREDFDLTTLTAPFVIPWTVPVLGAYFTIQIRSAAQHPVGGVDSMRMGS